LLGFSYSLFLENDPDYDNDGDGILDINDQCPNEAEDFDGFKDGGGCPDYYNDGDGILDINDQCPNEAEDFDGFEDEDGCPDYDNDGDGILDINDQCPNEAEDFDGFKDEDGCPDYDNDSDGILDIEDKCPDQHETINDFEDEDGCPDTVPFGYIPYRFNMQADSVFFKGSYKLRSEIKPHLDEIITMIKQLPHAIWRIEAHMDSFGPEREIQVLSLERAKAVLKYFVDFGGLPPEKFRIFGLGDKFPIGDNKTEEGRAKNRRILIIKE
jgi:outer membrane protein OmpA-like peptidoglycan-associated protein